MNILKTSITIFMLIFIFWQNTSFATFSRKLETPSPYKDLHFHELQKEVQLQKYQNYVKAIKIANSQLARPDEWVGSACSKVKTRIEERNTRLLSVKRNSPQPKHSTALDVDVKKWDKEIEEALLNFQQNRSQIEYEQFVDQIIKQQTEQERGDSSLAVPSSASSRAVSSAPSSSRKVSSASSSRSRKQISAPSSRTTKAPTSSAKISTPSSRAVKALIPSSRAKRGDPAVTSRTSLLSQTQPQALSSQAKPSNSPPPPPLSSDSPELSSPPAEFSIEFDTPLSLTTEKREQPKLGDMERGEKESALAATGERGAKTISSKQRKPRHKKSSSPAMRPATSSSLTKTRGATRSSQASLPSSQASQNSSSPSQQFISSSSSQQTQNFTPSSNPMQVTTTPSSKAAQISTSSSLATQSRGDPTASNTNKKSKTDKSGGVKFKKGKFFKKSSVQRAATKPPPTNNSQAKQAVSSSQVANKAPAQPHSLAQNNNLRPQNQNPNLNLNPNNQPNDDILLDIQSLFTEERDENQDALEDIQFLFREDEGGVALPPAINIPQDQHSLFVPNRKLTFPQNNNNVAIKPNKYGQKILDEIGIPNDIAEQQKIIALGNDKSNSKSIRDPGVRNNIEQVSAGAVELNRGKLLDRLKFFRHPPASGDKKTDYGFWAQGIYGYVKQANYRKLTGYKSKYYGAILGADLELDDKYLLGFSYSNIHNKIINFNNHRNNSVIDIFSLYGAWAINPRLSINSVLDYAASKVKTIRNYEIANMEAISWPKVKNYGIEIEAEYDFNVNNFHILPNIAIEYDKSYISNFSEEGIGINLKTHKRRSSRLGGILGIKVQKSWELYENTLVTPALNASINRTLKFNRDVSQINYIGATNYVNLSKDSLNQGKYLPSATNFILGCSLNFVKNQEVELEALAEYIKAKKLHGHNFSIKFRLNF